MPCVERRRLALDGTKRQLLVGLSAAAVGTIAAKLTTSAVRTLAVTLAVASDRIPVDVRDAAFAYLSVQSYRNGAGPTSTFTTSYNEAARKALITPMTTFYVRKFGSNNNDGLTPATAFRSLRLAVKMGTDTGQPFKVNYEAALPGEAPVLYRETNTHARSGQATNNGTWVECWRSQDLTQDAIFEPSVPGGIAFSVPDTVSPAYTGTADANIYQAATGLRHVYDFANRDLDGNPRRLMALTTVPADVNAPWPELNALYELTKSVTDGGTVAPYPMGVYYKNTNGVAFVRMFDNRNPNGDANVIHMGTQRSWLAPGISATPSKAINAFIEGMRFLGFEASGKPAFAILAAGGFRHRIDCVRTGFLGGMGDGALRVYGATPTDGSDVMLVNCQACYANLDGFNYHQNCTSVEIGCEGNWNGYDTGLANNGSTTHETSKVIRIGGRYVQNQDRAIHDVGDFRSWNLGISACSRRGKDGTEQSAAFASGHPANTGTVGKMWLDACKVLDGAGGPNQFPTESYLTSFLYHANLSFMPTAGPGTGRVAPYVP